MYLAPSTTVIINALLRNSGDADDIGPNTAQLSFQGKQGACTVPPPPIQPFTDSLCLVKGLRQLLRRPSGGFGGEGRLHYCLRPHGPRKGASHLQQQTWDKGRGWSWVVSTNLVLPRVVIGTREGAGKSCDPPPPLEPMRTHPHTLTHLAQTITNPAQQLPQANRHSPATMPAPTIYHNTSPPVHPHTPAGTPCGWRRPPLCTCRTRLPGRGRHK